MTQLNLALKSRVFFVLLYSLFLWTLAVALVNTFSTRLSVPNLAQNFAPALVVGTAIFGYSLYMTQSSGNGVTSSIGRLSNLSPRQLTLLLFPFALGAIFVALTGNRISTAAGIMEVMVYILGLFGAAVMSAFKPYLGICAMLITFPVAFLYHLNLRAQGWSDNFGVATLNPEIILVLVTFLSMQLGRFVRKSQSNRTGFDIPIAIFLIGTIIALLDSPGFLFSSRVVFAGTLVPTLCFIIIVNGLRTRSELSIVLFTLLLSFFLMGTYSLLTFTRGNTIEALLSGDERLTQFFTNPAFFSLMLTLTLPLTITLAASSVLSLKLRFVLVILAVILLTALIMTYIRGAWLGFAISLLLLLSVHRDSRRLVFRLAPFVLVGFLIMGKIISRVFWARNESIEALFQSTAWTDRIVAWESSSRMIVDNYLTGVGPGMYGVFYPDYEVAYLEFAQTRGMNAHNLFLNVFAETGVVAIVGLATLLGISLWLGWRLFRSTKDPFLKIVSLGVLAGVVGYIVNATTHGAMLAKVMLDGQSTFSAFTFYLFIFLGFIAVLLRINQSID